MFFLSKQARARIQPKTDQSKSFMNEEEVVNAIGYQVGE
jgi:hypothetical protein